jgi:predicted amidohydrolase
MDCTLGDVKANLAKIAAMAANAKQQGANLVIFPELATTGYFIGDRIDKLAEPVPGPTTEALTNIAKQHDIWLITGMAEALGDEYYNTSVLVSPDGLVGAYRVKSRSLWTFAPPPSPWAGWGYAAMVVTSSSSVAPGAASSSLLMSR